MTIQDILPSTRKPIAVVLALFVGAILAFYGLSSPDAALAAQGDALSGAQASELSVQASQLASAKASVIDKTAVANAKTMVKKAKATSGTPTAKLKKIFTYIATDKKWKGAFQFESYLTFWMKAAGAEKTTYYSSAAGPATMKGLYKKYAIDAFKLKKASCYHYAALFAIAAKQALGNKATVKIAVGSIPIALDGSIPKISDSSKWNSHHSWVEVTVGKKTYVYDTQQGNYFSKAAGKKSAFGTFCGSTKASVKAYYKNYKGAKYCAVTL